MKKFAYPVDTVIDYAAFSDVDFYKNHYDARKEKSILMQSLVDGYGARRIADTIYAKRG